MSDPDKVRKIVRDAYAQVAVDGGKTRRASSCCSPETTPLESLCAPMGYSPEELREVPQGANMGLGCGNPSAIASLQPGETVLDLGSGGGFDCFIASKQVGENGRVIGVDMTVEMIQKARDNARKAGYTNVEFRLGEIEHLPVADSSVDIIISNCVINLSPDKQSVYRDAYRVLKPGGRLAISDVVVNRPLPAALREDANLLAGCVAGAVATEDIEGMLTEAGFREIRITPREESRTFIREWVPDLNLDDYIVSATIEAVKP